MSNTKTLNRQEISSLSDPSTATSTWRLTFEEETGDQTFISGDTFAYKTLSLSAVYFGNSENKRMVQIQQGQTVDLGGVEKRHVTSTTVAQNPNATKTYRGVAHTVNTADYFNESNKSQRSIVASYRLSSLRLCSAKSFSSDTPIKPYGVYFTTSSTDLGITKEFVLNAPPIINTASVSVSTSPIFAGSSSATLAITAVAQYGGDISNIIFRIGNQSVQGTGNTLTLPLDAEGTFTPSATVVDSRGQATTKNFDAITVKAYSSPMVAYSAQRATATGVPDEGGLYAVLDATFTFTDETVLKKPTVEVDGSSVNTTWYRTRATDGTLSNAVDWSNTSGFTSPTTLYGLIGALGSQSSHQISVTPKDNISTGATITQTVAPSFFTIDFLAGGHGIAFGQQAVNEGFECDMPTTFHDTVAMKDAVSVVDANNTSRALFDFVHPVGSYYETSDASFDPNVTWGGTWVKDSNVPFVVEKSSSGIWSYLKWSDGTAECWGTTGARTVTSWSTWGGLYYGNPFNVHDNYPSGLFISAPNCQAQIGENSNDIFLAKTSGSGTEGTESYTPAFYPTRGSNGSVGSTYTINYYAIGRWSNNSSYMQRWHRTA